VSGVGRETTLQPARRHSAINSLRPRVKLAAQKFELLCGRERPCLFHRPLTCQEFCFAPVPDHDSFRDAVVDAGAIGVDKVLDKSKSPSSMDAP